MDTKQITQRLQKNKKPLLVIAGVVVLVVVVGVIYYLWSKSNNARVPSTDACSAFEAALENVRAQHDRIVESGCNQEGLRQLVQAVRDVVSTAKSNPMERREFVLSGMMKTLGESVDAVQCNQAAGAALADLVNAALACAQEHWTALDDDERAQMQQAAQDLATKMQSGVQGSVTNAREVTTYGDACAAFEQHYRMLRSRLARKECAKLLSVVDLVKQSVSNLQKQESGNPELLTQTFIDNMNQSVQALEMNKHCVAHTGAVVMLIYRAADCLMLRLQGQLGSRMEQKVMQAAKSRLDHYAKMLRAYVDEWVNQIKEQVQGLGVDTAVSQASGCPCGCAQGGMCSCPPSCTMCMCNAEKGASTCGGGCPYTSEMQTPYFNSCT